MNALIHGSAAYHTKLWMRECFRIGVVPLLQMHDALEVSVRAPEQTAPIAKLGCDVVADLAVPMRVDVKYGRNWGDAKHTWAELRGDGGEPKPTDPNNTALPCAAVTPAERVGIAATATVSVPIAAHIDALVGSGTSTDGNAGAKYSASDAVGTDLGNSDGDIARDPHVCVYGKLDPPDGTVHAIAGDAAWIHPRCEDAFIRARMAEEGIMGAQSPPPQSPPHAGRSSSSDGNGHADNFIRYGRGDGFTGFTAASARHKRIAGGSKAAIERDTYAREHAGKPFSDAYLLARGYALARVFDYTLADGTLLYWQNRYELHEGITPTEDKPHKRFIPHRMVRGVDTTGAGDRRVIYNWPAIMHAGPGSTVFVAEGENKASLAIEKGGLLATTVLSHAWTPECAAALTGDHVIILADHDTPGERYARDARNALAAVAASTRIVPTAHLWKYLPTGAPELEPESGADLVDWVNLGGDLSKLLDICREIPAEGVISAEPYQFPAEADIPPWEWLYGRHLLRGEVSITNATGGTGKSTLSIVEALAMASGRALLGFTVPAPLRVILINLEDARATMDKRIAAAMRHYGLTPADVGDRLIVIGKNEVKIKVAQQLRSGAVERNAQTIRALTQLAIEHRADVLSVDSLIRAHEVNENDNSAMLEVIECFETVARARCAVHLWHHNRKLGGERATIDAARGASAIMDAGRSGRALETMTAKEREQLAQIQPDMLSPGHYFRAFNGKRSFAPPVEESDWFAITSMVLANGDDVGVVTRWTYPASQATVTPEVAEAIVAEIDRGMPSGQRFSNDNAATKRAAWPIVQRHCPDKTGDQCRRIVAGWVKQGSLYEDEYDDPVYGKPRKGLFARRTSDEQPNRGD